MEQQHKRRVRYKGTHPRKFEEKYKEHNPEKYADTIEKVISKGSTPADSGARAHKEGAIPRPLLPLLL